MFKTEYQMEMFTHLSYKQRKADLITHTSPEEELIYRATQIMNTVRMTFVELFHFLSKCVQ